jgi:hypothetical protein
MAQRGVDAILEEARAEVAAGRSPDAAGLRTRLLAEGGDAAATRRLEQVLAVHRARTLLSNPPAPRERPEPARPLRAALRTRPTISSNMEVRRQDDSLVWDDLPAIVEWEIRFSVRADARADYVVQDERLLPAGTTTVEVPLGEQPIRVHVLGRSRDGRLLRRAVISGLTRENWADRWQRRASAS